jgi:hypothetical protein
MSDTWHAKYEKLKSDILVEKLDVGLITPEGHFFGCNTGAHAVLALMVLSAFPYRQLKDNGWVFVSTKPNEAIERYEFWGTLDNRSPNEKQRVTLREIGFDPEIAGIRRNEDIGFRDVFSNGYQNHPFPNEPFRLRDVYFEQLQRAGNIPAPLEMDYRFY